MKPVPSISAALLVSTLTLPAAVATWSGGPSGAATDFSDAANWTPAAPGAGDTAQFNRPASGQPVLNAPATVAGLDFVTPGGGWTLSGSGPLTLGAAGLGSSGQTSGLNTVNVASLVLGASSTTVWNLFDSAVAPTAATFEISSAIQLNPRGQLILKIQRPGTGGIGTVKLAGPISGTSLGGVKFQGAGGLKKNLFVLAGNNSSYDGPTVLSQATITFDALANTGASSSFGSAGAVTLGDNNSFACANYVGPGGTTDRPWLLGGAGGGSLNNNGTGPLAFTSTGSAIAGSGNRRLLLGGTNTANNVFAELLADAGGLTALLKNDAGTWTLANPANSYSGSSTLNGGTLQVSKLDLGGNPSCLGASASTAFNLVFNNATLTYTGAGDTSDRLFQMTGSATINNNGAGPLTFNNPGSLALAGGGAHTLTLGGSFAGLNTFAPSLGDSGATATSLTKRGTTTWLLTGANLYSGATTVRAGTLLVNGSLGTGPVLVGPGATLGGNGGTIAGAVTIQNGGTLALGSAISTLTISDALTFSGTSTNMMKVAKEAGRLSSDLVQGMSNLSFDGTLIVTASGAALAPGDSVQLFKAAVFSGAFAELRLPELPPQLSWDTSALATNGTLRVVGSAAGTVASPALASTAAPAQTSAPLAVSQAEVQPAARPSSAPVEALVTPSSAPANTDLTSTAASGPLTVVNGAVIRGPQDQRRVALVFSCRASDDSTTAMLEALESRHLKASFFVSSEFLKWPLDSLLVRSLVEEGHYVGPESDSWTSFAAGKTAGAEKHPRYPETESHLRALADLGVRDFRFFLPTRDQVNDVVAEQSRRCGLRMLAGSPGTLSLKTTTVPGSADFASATAIAESILAREKQDKNGLNGCLLLFPLDSGSRRSDQFASRFGALVDELRHRGYEFVRVDQLLGAASAR